MAVNLVKKGDKVNLSKGISLALVGLGWDLNKYDGGMDFDLDVSAFMLGDNDKVRTDDDFIFYGNLKALDGSIRHTGDDRIGGGEKDVDNEVLIFDFQKIPKKVKKIVVTVTIYDALARGQNFGQVSDAYVRIARMADANDMTGDEFLRYNLVEQFSIETAMIACAFERIGNDWRFNAIGAAQRGGLADFCRKYGVNV